MIGPYYVRGSKPVLRPRRTVLPGRPKGGEFVDQHEIQEEDRTAGPAETAEVRIDMGAWLRSLSRRQRTTHVAQHDLRDHSCRRLMVHQLCRWLRRLPLDADGTLNLMAGEFVHEPPRTDD